MFKSINTLGTDELLDKLGMGIILAFCVGFIMGTVLILTVFVIPTSDIYKNVVVPVSIILFLLCCMGFMNYIRKNLIPELKKRFREH